MEATIQLSPPEAVIELVQALIAAHETERRTFDAVLAIEAPTLPQEVRDDYLTAKAAIAPLHRQVYAACGGNHRLFDAAWALVKAQQAFTAAYQQARVSVPDSAVITQVALPL